MTLESAEVFEVTSSILTETQDFLAAAGAEGYEAFVLWSGTVDEKSRCRVLMAHMPAQTAYRTEHGLLVRIEGEALHKLNVWLFENGHVLVAQVHAHPTDAFHSETDDSFPIVTSVGGLSIVVPDFATRGVFQPGTAVYRLQRGKGWKRVRGGRLRRLIEVSE